MDQRTRTKLVCTLGPAAAERVRELVDAGMDVARINFSHGTPEDHKRAVDAVRAAAHGARRSVAVMVDLPGPKVRLGELSGGKLELAPGTAFMLRGPGEGPTEEGTSGATLPDPQVLSELQPGDRVLLADGTAELVVTGSSDGAVTTEVVRGGLIRSRSGVNVPSERLTGPALTEADREAIPRALQLKADLLAQSFVRDAADVGELRASLPQGGNVPPLVAKIETRRAVDAFDEIAAAADGVMIARGDLGADLPFEEVPLLQKELLHRARRAGRFAIVATQMLESMTNAARPTRAEASDVANAVLDGADAVMLSAETAIGRFPIEAAAAAVSICRATESRRLAGSGPAHVRETLHDHEPGADEPGAIVRAAVELAGRYDKVAAIWCFTRSGRTAELLSVMAPRLPIVAFTPTPTVARRLAVRGAVLPVVLSAGRTGEPLVRRMEAAARAQAANPGAGAGGGAGSLVLLVTTSAQPGGINRLELHEL